ncbi:Unknown protein [Striga hermonthica]|uniref:Uncharacterized protein n=1 Tax=Striga hermonthica TaxID=68872 RepID=A0A9N7MBB5_STRHE|nr:Unknown protein [Striga hermonthica]
MRVLGDSWCFCNGGGKSERMKASIFSGKAPAMARINDGGTGFLIHRNLLLTTHANLPSVAAVEAAEIRLHNGLSATLFPHRFFITSSVLDLTMVGLDALDNEVARASLRKTARPGGDQNYVRDLLLRVGPMLDAESTGSADGVGSAGEDDGPPPPHECSSSSDGEATTMYSAETAESRNIPSPRGEGERAVGRSQSCVNYYGGRWGPRTAFVGRGMEVERRRNFGGGRKVYSQGAAASGGRSNVYFSPTVSSIMKKRNNAAEQVQVHNNRQRPSAAAHTSPRWNF